MRPLLLAALILTLAAPAAFADVGAWSCRNEQLEIICAKGACAVSDGHTPMDVTIDAKKITACAYTGCWTGAPILAVRTGPWITVQGVDLPFSTNPSDRADVAVTLDARSGIAAVLVAGSFVNPMLCARR